MKGKDSVSIKNSKRGIKKIQFPVLFLTLKKAVEMEALSTSISTLLPGSSRFPIFNNYSSSPNGL